MRARPRASAGRRGPRRPLSGIALLALAACLPRETGWQLEAPALHDGRAGLRAEGARVDYDLEVAVTAATVKDDDAAAEAARITLRGTARWTGADSRAPTVVRVTAIPVEVQASGVYWIESSAADLALRPGREVEFSLGLDWDLEHGCPKDQACRQPLGLRLEWLYPDAGVVEVRWSVDAEVFGGRGRAAPPGAGISAGVLASPHKDPSPSP
ncbi:MAG: hypothetical protein KC636_02325 [Myxococcales bacterium]|nr:hypothetical protein [Myxococcales bacterium]